MNTRHNVIGMGLLLSLNAIAIAAEEPNVAAALGAPVLPVTLSLDKPGYVTAVIEDAEGRRVCNLVSEVKGAGKMVLNWDLYDVGIQPRMENVTVDGKNVEYLPPYVRNRVNPGTYRVRGVVHDGIGLAYEMSVYSPGNPAWKTPDTSGTWMGDHSAPSDVLFLERSIDGKPGFLFSCVCAESGHSLVWTDTEGRKIRGLGLGWDGGSAAVRDQGPKADREALAYIVGGDNGRTSIRRIDLAGKAETLFTWDPTAKKWPIINEYSFLDMAVHNGIAVVPNSDNWENVDPAKGNLLVVDLKTGKQLANIATTGPARGVTFDPDGKLYMAVGDEVQRFSLDPATGMITKEATVVSGVVVPRRVRLDAVGNLYVGDWGALHQIKVFSKAGVPIRTIGKAGGPQCGRYDEQRMDRPEGMTFDSAGRLWVAEQSHLPKRISVWKPEAGTFQRAIYGGPQYGGGGRIDPKDRSIFYYPSIASPMEKGVLVFKLDWDKGTSALTDIIYRTPLFGRQMAQSWAGIDLTAPVSKEYSFNDFDPAFTSRQMRAPDRAIYVGGHRYLYNVTGRGDTPSETMIWRWDEGMDKAVPVALLGRKGGLQDDRNGLLDKAERRDELKKLFDSSEGDCMLWTDRNSDGRIQPEEFQFWKTPRVPGDLYGAQVLDDLSIATGHLEYGLIPAPTIDAKGTPTWDTKAIKPLIKKTDAASWNGVSGMPLVNKDMVVMAPGGWEFYANPVGYKRDGNLLWSYRHHQIWEVPKFPGQLLASPRTMGALVRPAKGDAGDLWVTSCEKGQVAMFTMDGLYMKTFGGDVRTTPLWRFPTAKRGMSVDGVSWEDECFAPSLNQTADGQIYIVTGKEHVSINRVTGLESVRRVDFGTVTVTAEMVAGLPKTMSEPHTKQARKTLEVSLGGTAPVVDGKLDEWKALPEANVAVIDPFTKAGLWFADGKMFARFSTGNAKLLDNSAADARYMFKFGGALDLSFGAKWNPGNLQENNPYREGDCRVLIAKVKGKPTAILYRPVMEGADKKDQCVFESPIGREVFASVTDITSAMQFAESGTGDYEISLDMATVLRHKVQEAGKWGPVTSDNLGKQDWHEGQTVILGDVGIIRGNGQQNVQRVCWNNLDTWMTSDIPSEVRWRSLNWGLLKLVKQ